MYTGRTAVKIRLMLSQLNSLKKRLLLQIEAAEERVRESDGFNLLKERFQALSPNRRRLVKRLALALIVLPAVGLPLSFLYSSSKHLRDFKEKDSLARALLRVESGSAFPSHRKTVAEARKLLGGLAKRHTEGEGGGEERVQDLGSFALEKEDGLGFAGDDEVKGHQMKVSVPRLNIKQAVSLGEKIGKSLIVRKLRLKENSSYENHYDAEFSVVFFPPAPLRSVKKPRRGGGAPSPAPALNKKKKKGGGDD